MLASLCLAPLLMFGYAIPVSYHSHHSDLTPTALFSAQSCTTGPGAYAKATLTGAYMLGAQWGFGVEHNGMEFSIKPQLGFSYVDHHVRTLPARQQYHVGAEANVCYDRYCSGISFDHISNGDQLGICYSSSKCSGNVGEHILAFMTGVRFQ